GRQLAVGARASRRASCAEHADELRGRVRSAARRRRSRTPPPRIRPAGDGPAVAITAACPSNRKVARVSEPPIGDGGQRAFIAPLPRSQCSGLRYTPKRAIVVERARDPGRGLASLGNWSEPTTCGRWA